MNNRELAEVITDRFFYTPNATPVASVKQVLEGGAMSFHWHRSTFTKNIESVLDEHRQPDSLAEVLKLCASLPYDTYMAILTTQPGWELVRATPDMDEAFIQAPAIIEGNDFHTAAADILAAIKDAKDAKPPTREEAMIALDRLDERAATYAEDIGTLRRFLEGLK